MRRLNELGAQQAKDENGELMFDADGAPVNKLSYKLGMYVMIPDGTNIAVTDGLTLTLEQVFTLAGDLLPQLQNIGLKDGHLSLTDEQADAIVDSLKRVFGDTLYVDGNEYDLESLRAVLKKLLPILREIEVNGSVVTVTDEQLDRIFAAVPGLESLRDLIEGALNDDGTLDLNELAELLPDLNGMQEQMGMFSSYVNGGYTMYTVGINPAIDFESETSFGILRKIKVIANEIFGFTGMRCYFTGYTQGAYDFAAVTPGDYNMVTAISIVAILLILIFTLGGIKFPVLLVALIEFGIWVNLIMQYIFTGGTINFMSYLVITAVQLGATVDYAILITTKFRALRKRFEPRQAAYLATTGSVMSVLTSALIMAGACFSIFAVSSNLVIQEMTFLIARGALISAVLVIFVLPALLAFADRPTGGEIHFRRTLFLRPIRTKRRQKYVPVLSEPMQAEEPVTEEEAQQKNA